MKHLVLLYVFALLSCLNASAQQPSSADSLAVADSVASDSLVARADTLNGVVVTAKEIVRYDDHLLLYPNKNQRKHAANGFDVLENMMLPGVKVDRNSGSISALDSSQYITR